MVVFGERQSKYITINHQILLLKKPNGSFAIADLEKANLFKDHLAKIFQPHGDIIDDENMNLVERFLNIPLPMTLPVK
jgi:hypothetical protein